MASLFTAPQFDGGTGITPEDGLQLFFFEEGASTPKDTFTTKDLNPLSKNTNPVISDANGVFPEIWMPDDQIYRVVLNDKNDVLVGFGVVEDYPTLISLVPQDPTLSDSRYKILFQTVATLITGTPVDGIVIDFNELSTDRVNVSTKWNNTTTETGGADYEILTAGAFGAVPDGYADHYLDGGTDFVAKLIVHDNEINSAQLGIIGDGTVEKTAIDALEVYIRTNTVNALFMPGTFDVGNAKWPWRTGDVATGIFRDYGGITVRGSGKGVSIYRTTSNNGADVFNLVEVKGISFIEASITAVLTDTIGAGSNGVSIIHGAEDLYIDLDVFDCPYIDQGSFLDGGKAFTMQTSAATLLNYTNVTIKGKATNCGYAFGIDTQYESFNIDDHINFEGVSVDIIAEECWKGCSLSAAAATEALLDNGKDSGLTVVMTCIDVAQPLSMGRWVNADINIHTATNLPKSGLLRPFAADQTVYGANIEGDYGSNITITGRMREVDNKLLFGGTTQAFGVFGGSKNTNLNFSMDAETTIGADVVAVNEGGNVCINSKINLAQITGTGYLGFLEVSGIFKPEWKNTVSLQAEEFVHQTNIYQMTVKQQGQVYNTFSVDAVTGEVEMLRAGSGSAGSADGFLRIKDSASGVSYKVQLYL